MVNFLAACEIVESRNFPQAVDKSTIYIYIYAYYALAF